MIKKSLKSIDKFLIKAYYAVMEETYEGEQEGYY